MVILSYRVAYLGFPCLWCFRWSFVACMLLSQMVVFHHSLQSFVHMFQSKRRRRLLVFRTKAKAPVSWVLPYRSLAQGSALACFLSTFGDSFACCWTLACEKALQEQEDIQIGEANREAVPKHSWWKGSRHVLHDSKQHSPPCSKDWELSEHLEKIRGVPQRSFPHHWGVF